jgi:hypothetical protein
LLCLHATKAFIIHGNTVILTWTDKTFPNCCIQYCPTMSWVRISIVVILIAFVGVHSWMAIRNLVYSPIQTTVETVFSKEYGPVFPAVTVCPYQIVQVKIYAQLIQIVCV